MSWNLWVAFIVNWGAFAMLHFGFGWGWIASLILALLVAFLVFALSGGTLSDLKSATE